MAQETIIIPNDLCARAGIAGVFTPMENFTIFPYQYKTHQDTQTHFHPTKSTIFSVRKHVILFEEVFRKLVNESNGIFLNLQSTIVSKRLTDRHVLVQTSLEYRSVIRECLENLQEKVMRKENQNNLDELIMIFYSIECIWHLCEILLIEENKGNVVLKLLDWVCFHFPKFDTKSKLVNPNSFFNPNFDQNDYWKTVYSAQLKGKINLTIRLLEMHPNSSSEDFQMVILTLQMFPALKLYDCRPNDEYKLCFKHWQVETRAKIDAKLFSANEKLEFLMRLAVGERTAWFDIYEECEAWYEYLTGWLIYNEPMIKSYELGKFAKKCISFLGIKDNMKHLDKVILAIFDGDVIQVIKEAQNMTENGWFVTHLTDLFYHSGCLDIFDKTEGQKGLSLRLRESFLLDYGTLLMSHPSLWQLGLSYLDYCRRDGLNAIALMLPRIKSNSEAKTRKLIKEALKRKMDFVAQSLCKVQGKAALARAKPGTALTWALKSHDANFASQIADQLLHDYINNGGLKHTDLLHNLGPGMLISDRLTFLGKYSEFHKLYGEKKFDEAGKLLISLIASRITPKYFLLTLFIDALPLLECDVLVFSSKDTYTLLRFLEEKPDVEHSLNGFEENIKLLRMALARNLGRSLIYERQLNV